jgi:hypothetical protein
MSFTGRIIHGYGFRILNNGRRAISLVKYGLNFIADTLLNPFRPTKINVFDFLSCT